MRFLKITGKQRMYEGNKLVLVQLGLSFYTLQPMIRIKDASELTRLITNKKLSLKLLKEE